MTRRAGTTTPLPRLSPAVWFAVIAVGATIAAGCASSASEQTDAGDETIDTTGMIDSTVTTETSDTTDTTATSTPEQAITTLEPNVASDEPTTTTPKPASADDVTGLAESLNATLVIAVLPDESTVIWHRGDTRELTAEESAGLWTDGSYLYRYIGDDGVTGRSTAATLDGTQICDTDGRIRHVAGRPDGTYVMAVEPDETPERDITGEVSLPLFAEDCETGDRQPIEPMSFWGGEVESRTVYRRAGREFNFLGDAEGNADAINESGITVNGEDYAGYATFNKDASLMAYGDMNAGGGPHLTPAVVVRDTTTAEELWRRDFGRLVQLFDFVDDRLVIWFPTDDWTLINGNREPAQALVLDATTGEQLDEVILDVRLEIDHIS